MKKIIIFLLFIFFFAIDIWKSQTIDNESQQTWYYNISSVVQLVSFKDLYWKNLIKLWWWSATLINNKWIILTNSHVVIDEEWNLSDFFNICISKNENEVPICDYTASLIDYNLEMDIAILKINNKDINWNILDLWNFKYSKANFDYSPKSWDEVSAVWYPRIWSQTISYTKWIVSWIIKKSWYDYIKTDSLIAWWNSWWWLFDKNWDLIWIPTFTIWWYDDSQLWYALSIKNAKSFVEKNIEKNINIDEKNLHRFNIYKQKINKINKEKIVNNSSIKIDFPQNYEIMEYFDDWSLIIYNNKKEKNKIEYFSFRTINFPYSKTFNNFLINLENFWYFSPEYDKLKKIKIWWVDFYWLLYKNEISQINSYWNTYLWQLNNNTLWIIQIQYTNDSDTNSIEKTKQNIEDFFKNIQFNINESNFYEFNLFEWWIKIIDKNIISDEIEWFALKFLNSLDFIWINIYEKNIRYWKWENLEKVYNTLTTNINNDDKWIIQINWNKWFLYCNLSEKQNNENYNFYPLSPNNLKDESWNKAEHINCKIIIFDWLKFKNQDYILEISLFSRKETFEKNYLEFINFVKNNLQIKQNWNWTTQIINIFDKKQILKFKDLDWQSDHYKEKLKLLIKYWIIKNIDKFEPYKPLKRSEFLSFYLYSVYKINIFENTNCNKSDFNCLYKSKKIEIDWIQTRLIDIFDQMWIDIREYVNKDTIKYFPLYLELKIAWIKDIELSQYFFEKIEFLSWFNNKNTNLDNDLKQIIYKLNDLRFKYFWEKKIWIDSEYVSLKNIKFFPIKTVFMTNKNSIVEQQLYLTWNFELWETLPKIDDSQIKYYILTRWEAIDIIISQMDFWIFDEYYAKFKQWIVE